MNIPELEQRVEDIRAELHKAVEQLATAKINAAPWKAGQKIKDKKGEEATVLRVECSYGGAVPVVAYPKKDGTLGTREYRLYSWDLP